MPHEYMQTISIPQISNLDALKGVKSLYELSSLIGVETQFLTKVLYRKPYRDHYRLLFIPKKSGELRMISAPSKELSEIQSRIAKILYECRGLIQEKERSVGASSYGFEKGKGIYENASKHLNRRFVLNFDLEDFFPSIHIGRVKGFLVKDRNFGLDERMAEIISQIACNNGTLPQGSPLSPVLANMVCDILDRRLRKFCNMHRCSFTRYVDDITISTNLREFPNAVAKQNKENERWEISGELESLVLRAGYRIKHSKTRMQLSSQRQVVTGLTVNTTPMPVREFRYRTRAMCHRLFTQGSYEIGDRKYDISRARTEIRPLKGRILYLSNVSSRAVVEGREKKSSGELLLNKFIYFESFAIGDKPLLITEGVTDRLYLKHAQKFRKLLPPELLEEDKPKFDIFKPTMTRKLHLKLGDGAQQIKDFIFRYSEQKSKFGYYPRSKPIMCVLDSDGEGKRVLNAIKSKFEVTEISASVFHIFDEIYLIYLNHFGENKEIENYFSDDLLNRKIEDRSFELLKDEGDTYSKSDFAKYVVHKYGTEKHFTGFAKIFGDVAICMSANDIRLRN